MAKSALFMKELHERALKITYVDKISSFKHLQENYNSISIQ